MFFLVFFEDSYLDDIGYLFFTVFFYGENNSSSRMFYIAGGN